MQINTTVGVSSRTPRLGMCTFPFSLTTHSISKMPGLCDSSELNPFLTDYISVFFYFRRVDWFVCPKWVCSNFLGFIDQLDKLPRVYWFFLVSRGAIFSVKNYSRGIEMHLVEVKYQPTYIFTKLTFDGFSHPSTCRSFISEPFDHTAFIPSPVLTKVGIVWRISVESFCNLKKTLIPNARCMLYFEKYLPSTTTQM